MSKESILKEENETLAKYLEDLDGFCKKESAELGKLQTSYDRDFREAANEGRREDVMEAINIANKALKRKGFGPRKDYLDKLKHIMHSPYFGRIDLKEAADSNTETFYIGKLGYPGYTKGCQITDWRAPIASVYYNYPFAAPNVSFQISALNALDTDKTITADLKVRRTIEVEHRKLLNVYDDSLLENVDKNAFLLTKLKEKSGGRLEDIIETIQSDQNEILRYSPFKNIVVQGVAGSGKTTIAIHRISYIFYNFAQKILPSETLFISTSKVLINYLEKSLPELDIYHIKRASLSELLKEIIAKNSIFLKTPVQTVETPKYFQNIENFILKLESFVHKQNELIKENFFEEVAYKSDATFIDFVKIFEKDSKKPALLTVLDIQEDLLETAEEIRSDIRENTKHFVNSDIEKRRLENVNFVLNLVRKYLKTINLETLYLQHLQESYKEKTKAFELNNLCGFYLLAYKLGGLKDMPDFNLVILDEAQDLNLLGFHCVKTLSTKNCFNFFGDLNQAIGKRFSINRWEEMYDIFGKETINKFELSISYRSTKQIVERANQELIKAGITTNLPEPVSREGDEPTEQSFLNQESLHTQLTKEIHKLRKENTRSIGIILTEDIEEASLKQALFDAQINFDLITDFFDNFKKDGIYLVPLKLVKGLEFDSVFILNSEASEFKDSVEGHYKKFVSITRAMRKLFIYTLSR